MAATQDSCEDNIALGPDPRPGLAGPPTRLPDMTTVDVDTTAVELSYRRLSETAARVFRLLPVSSGPDVSADAVAALADLPVSEVRRILADLARAHLIQAASNGGERWWMHDLVRRYAQQLSDAHADDDGREQGRDRLIYYYLSMAEAADYRLRGRPPVAVLEQFPSQEDALAWLDAERECLTATVRMAADTGRDHAMASLPLLLAQYLARRRRFGDLLATTIISLDAARRLGDRDSEGDALNNLGGALLEVQRSGEAVTAYQDAASAFRETGDRRGEGDALNNLGVALSRMRRLDESIAAHQDAATIYRETGDRHGEAKALANLGVALRESGRAEEAVGAWQHAADIFRETGDRRGQRIALENIGPAAVHSCGTGRLG